MKERGDKRTDKVTDSSDQKSHQCAASLSGPWTQDRTRRGQEESWEQTLIEWVPTKCPTLT